MINKKIVITIIVFSSLLFVTSIIKNKTRVIEKNIVSYQKKISLLEKNLYESQIDFHYLSSPKILEEKISFLSDDEYKNMSLSEIYLNYESFMNEQNKISKK